MAGQLTSPTTVAQTVVRFASKQIGYDRKLRLQVISGASGIHVKVGGQDVSITNYDFFIPANGTIEIGGFDDLSKISMVYGDAMAGSASVAWGLV